MTFSGSTVVTFWVLTSGDLRLRGDGVSLQRYILSYARIIFYPLLSTPFWVRLAPRSLNKKVCFWIKTSDASRLALQF